MTILKLDKYFKGETPVHQTSWCAFLDVLGFSNAIEYAESKGTSDALLGTFHGVFAKQVAALKEKESYSELYFKTFSDNVLLACPLYTSDGEGEFATVLFALASYQLRMALAGFFIRGGLTLGPLFVDENQVFGQALVDAHAIESTIAVNPIVVMDDAARCAVDKQVKFYADNDAPHVRAILKGPDGRYFINYLRECVLEGDYGYIVDANALGLHRDNVVSALTTYRRNPRVFAKFAWLAEYHNYFCDTVAHHEGFDPSLKVDPTLAAIHFSLIAPSS